jgi:hypothetical protein
MDPPCPFVCSNGACVPDSQRCTGDTRETCDAMRAWGGKTTCPEACVNGSCVSCKPGAKRCGANGGVETCSALGTWDSAAPCQFACIDSACAECKPSSTSCIGTLLRTCRAQGKWDGGAAVMGNCGAVCSRLEASAATTSLHPSRSSRPPCFPHRVPAAFITPGARRTGRGMKRPTASRACPAATAGPSTDASRTGRKRAARPLRPATATSSSRTELGWHAIVDSNH